MRAGTRSDTAWDRAKLEVDARLAGYEPARLPDDKAKEIKAIMTSYAGSKGIDRLPEVAGGWVG